MKTGIKKFSFRSIKTKSAQKGIVLLITLLVLVATMLVAAAIIRSTDTSLLAVGNLSLRQASRAHVNYAVERVVRDISSAITNNAGFPNYIRPTLGPQNDKGIPNVLRAGNTPPEDGSSFNMNVGGGSAAGGFTIYGVVERMCSNTFTGDMNTAPNPTLCMVTGLGPGGNIGIAQRNDGEIGVIQQAGGNGAVFRVTVRVDGPKNTTVYAQAFLS